MKKILFVNPFGIGDALFTMTLAEAVRREKPEAQIGFLCNERTCDLVRLNASIDQTFVVNRDHFRGLWRESRRSCLREIRALCALIRDQRYEAVVDLSLGREFAFFAWWIGIRRRIGLDYRRRGLFLNDRIPIEGYEGDHAVEIQARLLTRLGLPGLQPPSRISIRVPEHAKHLLLSRLRQGGIVPSDRVAAFAPGGGKSWGPNAVYKQWDPDRFAAVAARRRDLGEKILLLGDSSERALLEKVAKLSGGPAVVLAGEPVEFVVAALERSGYLLCNDGGLMHLANALGIRTVAVFGPVDDRVYGPYGSQTAHATVTADVPCRPCYHRFHFPPCPHERRCLTGITVEKVAAAVEKIA